MGTILEHIVTGKLVKFLVSIPTIGQGALHLVEDIESGFVRAHQTLEQYRLADDQSAADDLAAAEAATQTPTPAPEPTPPPAPVAPPSMPALAPTPPAPTAPAVSNLPPLGA